MTEMDDHNKDFKSTCIVRVATSVWHDSDGMYIKKAIKYLKRRGGGYVFIDEECDSISAMDVIARIANLSTCKDGVYRMVICNERKDWESGFIEEWDYKLMEWDTLHGKAI